MSNIEKIDDFLTQAQVFYLSTVSGNKPKCRPLGFYMVVKVSGCFRSEDGIRDYLAAMSYIGTAKKHGKNAFQAILNVFVGNTFFAIED